MVLVAASDANSSIATSPPCRPERGRRGWKDFERKVSVFANSLLGNFLLCQSNELIGDFIGGSVGKVLGGLALSNAFRIASLSILFLTLNSVTMDATRTSLTVAFVAIAVFTAVAHCTTIHPLLTSSHGGQEMGESLGESIGNIVGGFIGLTFARCPVIFYDPSDRSLSYSVGMLRYKVVGYLFDRIIFSASFPVSMVRKTIKLFFQSIGYNSHLVIPACGEWARKKNFSRAFIPFAVELSCSRYCDANGNKLSKRVMGWLMPSLDRLPDFLSQVLRVMGSVAEAEIKKEIGYLSGQTARYTTLTMRGLYQYISLLKSPEVQKVINDRRALKTILLEKIDYSRLLAPLITPELLSKFCTELLESVQDGEKALLGFGVLNVAQFLEAKQNLAFHLKFYVLFMIGNHQNLLKMSELTDIEERDFLIEINQSFWSIYGEKNCATRASRYSSGKLLRLFYSIKLQFSNFVMRAEEQNTLVVSRLEVKEMHVERPATPVIRPLGEPFQEIKRDAYMPSEFNRKPKSSSRIWKLLGYTAA